MLKDLARSRHADAVLTLHASDFMDDGSMICLTVSIDASTGDATFDFDGTYTTISNAKYGHRLSVTSLFLITYRTTLQYRLGHHPFPGTSPEVYGNCNAPRAVTYSAIIYCLRCMVEADIPLNQGCLKPVTVKVPIACSLCVHRVKVPIQFELFNLIDEVVGVNFLLFCSSISHTSMYLIVNRSRPAAFCIPVTLPLSLAATCLRHSGWWM